MISFARLPIRQKLTVAIVCTAALALALACSVLILGEYLAFERRLQRDVAALARITADNSTAAIAFDDREGAQQTLGALRADPQIAAATLYDAMGSVFAHYAAEPADRPAAEPLDGGPPGGGLALVDGRVVFFAPVVEDGRRWGTLRLEATRAEMFARLRTYGGVVLIVVIFSIALAWGLAWALERRITRPIFELVRTAREVGGRDDYSLRAREFDRDELGELTQSFNQMLERIQTETEARRRASEEVRQLNASLEQRVRERTAELEALNKELEAFSYSVSHDLRAPLRHIHGYTEMLSRAINGQLSDKARRYLHTINSASEEMGQLIDDLLAFSRMGRTELREEVIDLGAIVDEVRRGQELAIKDRELVWRVSPLPRVRADGAMIKLALANLIGNAVKFTRTRATAEIQIATAGAEGGRVIVSVRDNGVGFDMSYYDKLFGVFQRLHRADEFEGTGIGLANVRRIIARHGGRVWAESTVGEGATFCFTLQPAESQPVSETTN